jgi:DnaJ-class molecular chaperone
MEINIVSALEILGIDENIDIYKINEEYIKKQYHSLALKHHPDKNGNTKESNEKFQKINEAYQYLLREVSILNAKKKKTMKIWKMKMGMIV